MASPAPATGSAAAGPSAHAGAPAPGGDVGAPAGPAPRRGFDDRALVAITVIVTAPILWMGYGTDLDTEAVRRTGALIRDGDYFPSRNPGVPVFEAVVALLDPLGPAAVNLAAAAAAAATVVGIAHLVRSWDRPNGDLVALAFLAAPITLIAATSTADFIYAVAFLVWAALLHRRDRTVVAGLLVALAVGSRSSTAVLVAVFLLADAWEPQHRGRCLRTGLTAVPPAVALYLPSWLAYDRTAAFLDHTSGWQGLASNLGRFAYKNYAVAGIALVVVVGVAAPALVRSLGRWRHDSLVRTAVLGFAVTQAMFLRMPWKPAHLLPAVLMLVLWLAASDRNRRGFLWVLIGAVALNGMVAFRLLAPDDPNSGGGAHLEPAVTLGLLANDMRCRARYMDEVPTIVNGAWSCHLEPVRGVTESGNDGDPVDDQASAPDRGRAGAVLSGT